MAERYPVGTGWWVGSMAGGAIGIFVGALTGELTVGLVAFVATGVPFGVTFERRLATRPLTTAERQLLVGLFALGVVGFLLALRFG